MGRKGVYKIPNMTVNGRQIDVDIRAELEQFEWNRANWSDEKLIAVSPFRYDNTPSFYVYLEDTANAYSGNWGDSGAYDAEYAKGGFLKLLAFLREETEEETAEYLTETYAPYQEREVLALRLPRLKVERSKQTLDESVLDGLAAGPSTYLTDRGIAPVIQRLMDVRDGGSFIALPWRLPDGRLANVKYRSKRGKTFWYAKNGFPIRGLIYGIDVVYKRRIKTAVLAEAEIDAQTWSSAGTFGIACGGSAFNGRKADIILQSPIERVIVVTDNDKAGVKLRAEIERYLYGKIEIAHGYVDPAYKDANEMRVRAGVDALKRVISDAVAVERRLQLSPRVTK